MELVLKLEGYRRVQPPGFLPGTDCCRGTTGLFKVSKENKVARQDTEIQSASSFAKSSKSRKAPEQQKLLDDDDRNKRKQKEPEEKKVA